MHDRYLCGTSCDCGPWGQCLEGPLWPPGGPASRSPGRGIGLACVQVQAMQVLCIGGLAGMAGGREAALGKPSWALQS